MKFAFLILAMALNLPLSAGEYRTLSVATTAPANRTVSFVYRLPQGWNKAKATAVMVIFGGRNWDATKTLERINFRAMADRFGLILLSPGFKDDEYWQPEKWSGAALATALQKLEKECGLKQPPLIYYGYSAGGQCANLFYCRNPERVIAWGVHACGVWGNPAQVKSPAPGMITCGVDDRERWEVSRNFAQRVGDMGWRRLWTELPGGHELSPEALKLAEAFFTAILAGEKNIAWGDDQTGIINLRASAIDPDLRSYLPGDAVKSQWQQLMGRR